MLVFHVLLVDITQFLLTTLVELLIILHAGQFVQNELLIFLNVISLSLDFFLKAINLFQKLIVLN